MSEVEALFADARRRLVTAPREALGELQSNRRVLGVRLPARIVPRGDAWHLGVLLLTEDRVVTTGDVVRARREVRRGYTAESQRRRAELAAAARRGGFAEGQTVHIGWSEVVLDDAAQGVASDRLVVRDGVPSVRWSASGGLVSLEDYLHERVELLLHPLPGA